VISASDSERECLDKVSAGDRLHVRGNTTRSSLLFLLASLCVDYRLDHEKKTLELGRHIGIIA
jgi:hypothetical protein